jgi:uncharacterized membrane protein (UPF0127 family)
VTKKTVVVLQLAVARTMLQRMIGLLRHTTLEDGHGLLIVSCNAIHTIGMRFAIDAAFLDREGRVVALKPRIVPGRVLWPVPSARSVVELAAGRLSHIPLELGDHLVVIP